MDNNKFVCKCGKSYKFSSGLSVHKRNCPECSEQKPKKNIQLKITEKDEDIKSVSSIGSENSNASSIARILELETELKFKDLETKYQLKLKDLELENTLKIKELEFENQKLQLQLQMKDLEINLLKNINVPVQQIVQQPVQQAVQQAVQQPVQQPIQQIVQQPVVHESKQTEEPVIQFFNNKKSKTSTIDNLNLNYLEALTIEESKDLFKDSDYNKCLYSCLVSGKDGLEKTILDPNYIKSENFTNSISQNAIDIIGNLFLKLEKNKLPFYCSDKNRNILYLKTQNGWIKSTESEFDIELFSFIRKALLSVQLAVGNTADFFKIRKNKFKEMYNLEYEKWDSEHKCLLGNLYILSNSEDHRLALKKLKVLMSKMSPNIKNTDSDEE